MAIGTYALPRWMNKADTRIQQEVCLGRLNQSRLHYHDADFRAHFLSREAGIGLVLDGK